MDFGNSKIDTDNSVITFDTESLEIIAEKESLDNDFQELLDSRSSSILKEFRGSDEFSEKKRDLSELIYGEIAELHDDKQKYLVQCAEEYKKQWRRCSDDGDTDFISAQQKWENALKEYDVSSSVLNEKYNELEERKTSVAKTIFAGIMSVVGAISTPEDMKIDKMYGKYTQIEQQNEIEKGEISRYQAIEMSGSGPEPPTQKNNEEKFSKIPFDSKYLPFSLAADYYHDITVSCRSSELDKQEAPPVNTLDHKHCDQGFKYFDKIASSEGAFMTLPDRNFFNDVLDIKESIAIDYLQNSPTELSQNKVEELIESGNSIKKMFVVPGETFIRISGESDSGKSPYFTNFEQIKDISFIDKNGDLHLDEETFKDRFSLPESSSLDVCRIYEVRKFGTIYSSTVAESVEHYGKTKHSGGGEQYLFLNRDELINSEPEQKIQVHTYSKEDFNNLLNNR